MRAQFWMLNQRRKANFGDTEPMQTEDIVTEINCKYMDRIQMDQEKVHWWIIHSNELNNPESLVPRFRPHFPHPNRCVSVV
jgi:hypothetical protein